MTEGPIDDPKTVEDVRKEPIRLAAGQEKEPLYRPRNEASVCVRYADSNGAHAMSAKSK